MQSFSWGNFVIEITQIQRPTQVSFAHLCCHKTIRPSRHEKCFQLKTMQQLLCRFCTFNMEGSMSFCTSWTLLVFKFDSMHVNEASASPSPTFPHPALMERKMQLLGISPMPFAFALFFCEDLNFVYFIILPRELKENLIGLMLQSIKKTLWYVMWCSKKCCNSSYTCSFYMKNHYNSLDKTLDR